MRDELSLREKLAELEHDQWKYWAEHVIDEVDDKRKRRWVKIFKLKYADLSEEDKEADRLWANKVIDLLERERVLW